MMKHCAYIASKRVCSDHDYIVYGFTAGLIGGADDLETARRLWENDLARCRERGRESDALLFEWNHDHWLMCGTLYDLHGCTEGVLAMRA